MNTFNYFYGVTLLQLVLRHSDNRKHFKNPSVTFCQEKKIVDLTLQTINSLRSESEFELLWQKTVQQADVLEITLPRKRKQPAKLLNENETSLYNELSQITTFIR